MFYRFYPKIQLAFVITAYILVAGTVNGVYAASETQEVLDTATVNSEYTYNLFLPAVQISSDSPEQLTEANDIELQKFVNDSFANAITVEEADEFFASLTSNQKEKVIELVDLRIQQTVERLKSEELNTNPVRAQAIPPDVVWTQDIEYNNAPYGTTANTFYRDWLECDGDENDADYIFVYSNYSGAQNPDGIRYTVTSASVRAALGYGYVNLKGFGYSYNEVKLCVGPSRVESSGGGYHWRNNLGVIQN